MTRTARFALALALALPLAAQAQVTLQRKVQEGKVSNRSVMKVDQTLSIAGQEVKTAVVADETVTHEVLPAADGSHKIVRRGEALTVSLNVPGLEAKFDSKDPATAKTDNPMLQPMLEMWAALAKGSFTMTFDKEGRLTALEGIDQLLAGLSPAAADLLRGDVGLAQLQRDTAQELKALPDGPVRKGDKWQRVEVMNVGAGQSLTFDTHYEYAGSVERDGRKLEKVGIFLSSVKYAQEGDGLGGAKVTASDLKVTGSTGHYLLDPATGLVVERHTNTVIAGSLTLEINGMAFPATLNLTLDAQTTSKR